MADETADSCTLMELSSDDGFSRAVPDPRVPHTLHGLVGSSELFRHVLRKIPRLAASDATVLITGETGTGKELVAHAVHAQSPRRGAPFIPVHCGALPEDLVENELFGDARGAYTGAAGSGKGLLAEAEGGTLFLDELNGLSLSAQAKLLRFLQNREYRILGSTHLLRADVRIVAASNVDLPLEVKSGAFRADLFHRLHVLSIEMPPLRARREDVPQLAGHFARVFGGLYGREGVGFTPGALELLALQDWPGNVRELQSLVERVVLLAPTSDVTAEDLHLLIGGLAGTDTGIGGARLEAVGESGPAVPLQGVVGPGCFRAAKSQMIREFERSYLIALMEGTEGNVSRAAQVAGMQRRDLQRLLRKHDVRRAGRVGRSQAG